ncbi:MAG: hypothetical protein N3D10_02390 [Candidatus Micrarchaeota archaeon]|nr:hypothetical protein [Candidatus Micrarchaeota archaeon]
MLKFNDKELALILFFIALSILASNISISKVWGSSGQTFTLFEFFAPLPAAFLGPIQGIIILLVAKIFGTFFSSAPLDLVTLLRFIPPIFAAYFFATFQQSKKNNILNSLIVLSCIFLFVLHPVGQQAWLFSLYWFIPIIVSFLPISNVFFRALGSTFSQHAIGSVIWIYFVSSANPEFWLALIPIVAIERLIFASGMAISYLGALKLLSILNNFIFLRYFKKQPIFVPYLEKQKRNK